MTRNRTDDVPIPTGNGDTVVAPPGRGFGYWAGGPSAVATRDEIYLAYRLRRPVDAGRGYAVVVARSRNGLDFEPLVTLEKEAFGTASFERPALVMRPDGKWRLYMSCSTPNSFHWWIDAVDADSPDGFRAENRVTVMPGDAQTAVKDPVVTHRNGTWDAWVCCHPLDDEQNTDRMVSRYASSIDGLTWTWGPVALAGRQGEWDARGVRISAVLMDRSPFVAYYDGRATAAENWGERTGLANADDDVVFAPLGHTPVGVSREGAGTLRYVSVVPWSSGYRLYYEASRADGAHEIRTELWLPGPAPGDGAREIAHVDRGALTW
jgi:hypothetical protein